MVPRQSTQGSVGFDLFSAEDVDLGSPQGVFTVSTGLVVEPPPGHFVKIEGRSGLSASGILAAGGVIDSDYRGEVKVILINVFRQAYMVRVGDRIAQAVCLPYCNPSVQETREVGFSASQRGAQGFGSTGR